MKNNKGFSLVELIIVIAIMAILVGVMAPQLI
ncbi:MAG: prepilin-type N-terminal cleavage/methylation domain-containing protein, partial [Lachnospiraceae bacterium]|nr:prepilin-type N-terminal cleavage/methylation domain-containing protein [Lachnospiraceae bacterium]